MNTDITYYDEGARLAAVTASAWRAYCDLDRYGYSVTTASREKALAEFEAAQKAEADFWAASV